MLARKFPAFATPAPIYRLSRKPFWSYVAALAAVAAMSGLVAVIPQVYGMANLSMLYLLVVFATALWFGRGPALFASVLSYLAIDWFFITPHSLFNARDIDEVIALFMFILTAAVTGQFTAELRLREAVATQREREAATLADASWAVAFCVERDNALRELLQRVAAAADLESAVITVLPEERDETSPSVVASWDGATAPGEAELRRSVEAMLASGKPQAWPPTHESVIHPWRGATETACIPLRMDREVLGALHLRWPSERRITPERQRVVEALANHAALVLQRDRLLRIQTHARVLQEADRLKTALLQMVSHDFRSPLTSIKAGLSGLRQSEGMQEPLERELLQAMDLETDRLIRMVDNVLALSQLEAGACQPQRDVISVAELVGATLDTFSDEQNARIRLEFDRTLTDAWLDEVQMVQVLHNLLENALKYSPAGTMVELRAGSEKGRLLFQVADRGPGLPEGEEQSVFDRFYRGPGLKESAIRGLGLGLALSRGLVEAHGGELLAANRPDGGTVFTVSLPMLHVEEPAR